MVDREVGHDLALRVFLSNYAMPVPSLLDLLAARDGDVRLLTERCLELSGGRR